MSRETEPILDEQEWDEALSDLLVSESGATVWDRELKLRAHDSALRAERDAAIRERDEAREEQHRIARHMIEASNDTLHAIAATISHADEHGAVAAIEELRFWAEARCALPPEPAATWAEVRDTKVRAETAEAQVTALREAVQEFVDEAVNGDHFCGGVPTEWTDRIAAALAALPAPPDEERVAKQMRRNSERWFPQLHDGSVDLRTFYALGLAGEAGEVANVVKKGLRSGSLDLADLGAECADVWTYLLLLVDECGIDLMAEYESKIEVNEQRWGVKRTPVPEGGE